MSYAEALVALACLIILFAFLLGIAGLLYAAGKKEEHYM